MATILFYLNMSSTWVYTAARLYRQRAVLRSRGVCLLPDLYDETCEARSAHRLLDLMRNEDGSDWQGLSSALWLRGFSLGIKRHCADGQVLLVAHTLNPALLGRAVTWLRQVLEMPDASVSFLVTLGHLDCVMEQRCRIAQTTVNVEEIFAALQEDRLLNPLEALQELQASIPECSIRVSTEDAATFAYPEITKELDEGLFNQFACKAPPLPDKKLFPHTLRLHSREMRFLFHQCATWNCWNFPQGRLYAELTALENDMEGELDFRPLSSPLLRQGLQEVSAGVGLTCVGPDDKIPWEPWTPATPHLEHICAYLSPTTRQSVLNRLRSDAPFLHSEQKKVAEILWRTAPAAVTASCRPWREPAPCAVLTLAFNHEKFISDCIESVLAQRTDFPVDHIVLDDNSTDRTREIIAYYAERHSSIKPVFPPCRTIPGRNVLDLFARARNIYVALCEGDDYFTDPYKLQTQVDFMEAHPECGLCFHPVKVVYEDGSSRERIYPPLGEMPRGMREFYYLADLMRVNFIQTNSVMYRWRFTEGLPDWFVPDLVPGDWYWHLLHAERGKIGFINKVMSVYRRHAASLFYASEISPKANRLKHGLSELRSYDTIGKHFSGRYANVLQPLANSVFSNFLEHYMEKGDDALLTAASEYFPELTRNFFAEIKIVRVSGGRS